MKFSDKINSSSMERMHEEQAKTLDCDTVDKRRLIVFNDHFNTFGHVIQTLVKACKHNPEQAEQCAWIIHYTGQCVVKEGFFNNLKPMCELICDSGIKAKII